MSSENDRIVGQVCQIYGNSCFSVLPVGDNNEIKAKTIGTMCDMRHSSKGINKISKGSWVLMTKTNYKVRGNIQHLIYQKLNDKDGKKFIKTSNDSMLNKHSDILDISNHENENNININEEFDIDNL